MKSSRELILEILLDIDQNKAYSNLSIQKHLDLEENFKDENFVRELVYGVIENQIYLDYIIRKNSKVRLKKIHPNVLNLLRMGIYQLLFMDKVPDRASIYETVELAKSYANKGSVGYINGLLRNVSRDKEGALKISANNKLEYISIKTSHPLWLVENIANQYGEDFAMEFCQYNNTKPKLNIRVNSLKTNRESLKARLEDKGLLVSEGKYSNYTLIIENPSRITQLDEFKEGLFTIQDESSSLVAQVMDIEDNMTVIDLCSAPGGKTSHIGERLNNTGRILAFDIHRNKLDLIRSTAYRLGIKNIVLGENDGSVYNEKLDSLGDIVLLDVPCSGLGIMRRKPDIKLNKEETDIIKLNKIQKDILKNGARYVKSGGQLVYSTCTIDKRENIDIIKWFLSENKDFNLVSIGGKLASEDGLNHLNQGYLDLYPHVNGTDGFFIAKMVKE